MFPLKLKNRNTTTETKNTNSYYKLMPTITKIVSQSANPNRVNIFVDDKFLTGIDKFTWISHNLKVGSDIPQKLCEELKKQDINGKAYDKVLKLLSFRPQSIFEVRQKLKTKFNPETIQQAVRRLKKEGWLDDQKFAEHWVKERSQTRARSITHLKAELIQKGIASNIIHEVLSSPDLTEQEFTTAQKLIEKFRHSKTPDQLKAYLSRKGFSYSVISKALFSRVSPP
ncbi:MAG: RecX family transcriptional regulator [Patescibacteria group bacterium]